MTKEEKRMDLLMTLAEIQVSKGPIFIDLTYDLWNLVRARLYPLPIHNTNTTDETNCSPFKFLKVYLNSNGRDGEIYLSYHKLDQKDRETISYKLKATDYE